MPTVDNPTEKALAELGVNDPQGVAEKFAEVRARFDRQVALDADGIRNLMLQEAWLGSDPDPVTSLRNFWVGRKAGVLTQITENWLKKSPPSLKGVIGKQFNELKTHIETKLEEQRKRIEERSEASALTREQVDLSLPGVLRPIGSRHLIRQVLQEIEDIFVSIGFSVVEGPEIETPYYNFEALNIPAFHPVPDDLDSFSLEWPEGAPADLLLLTPP